MIPASAILELIGSYTEHRLLRHEIFCEAFQRLRVATFRLLKELADEETGDPDIASQLRRALSEWLTVPVPFSSLDAAVLADLGSSTLAGQCWGADINRDADAARDALRDIHRIESPLQVAVADAIVDAELHELDWRIYCHRAAAEHFLSVASSVGCDPSRVRFIHSLSAYRRTAPFDLLIKVGPFRTRGWGAAPRALIHSPRYLELRQFVWAGSFDEAGFGEDPLLSGWADGETVASASDRATRASDRNPFPVTWAPVTITVGPIGAHPSGGSHSTPDELHDFAQSRQTSTSRRAVLLHLANDMGVLYAANSKVLLLNPRRTHKDAVHRHELADIDPAGLFLIWPEIDDVSVGGHVSDNGSFSLRWKEELRRRAAFHRAGLLRNLRAAGITLRDLDNCLDHWMQPPTSVIHAPQERQHFRMLIEVLEMEAREPPPPDASGRSGWWWQAAWREVARSRGTAIQFGMQEQELIDGELERVLLCILPEMRSLANERESFVIQIPADQSLSGAIAFLRVIAKDDGFCAPDSCLKTIFPIAVVEEWRA